MIALPFENHYPIVVGVIADTHIPDRVDSLHPQIIPMMRERGVRGILHAGDICLPGVIEELQTVAPVCAVQGNRDFLFKNGLAKIEKMEIGGVSLVLMHGHGSFKTYLTQKWDYIISGYRLRNYIPILKEGAGDAKVIVFGHTHAPENVLVGDTLLFNPGSACIPSPFTHWNNPSVGFLTFSPGGNVSGEIVELTGARAKDRKWQIA